MSFALDTFYTDFEDGHTVIVDTSGCHEFVKVADGVWQTEFEPIEYARYTLEVEVPGYDRITAMTVFPPKMSVEGDLSYRVHTYDNRKIWIYGLDYNPSTLQYETVDYIYASDRYVDNFNLTEVTKDDIEEFRRPENLDIDALLYGDPPRNPGCVLFIWEQDWIPYIAPPGMVNSKSDIRQEPVWVWTLWPNDYGYNFHDRYLRWEYRGPECKGSIYKKYENHLSETIVERDTNAIWIVVNFKPYSCYVPHPLSRLCL